MSQQRPSVDDIRLGNGLSPDRRDEIIDQLRPLDSQLARLPVDGFDAELSVKDGDVDRDHNKKQYVTFEVWAAGGHRYVTTSREPDFADALTEVRDDMRKMIGRALDKQIDRKRRSAGPKG